jgi:general secretion pathway protein D
MNPLPFTCVIVLCGLWGGAAYAQAPASDSASTEHADNGIPLERIIATVAKKTGKKFLIDPRVHANANIVGQELSNLTYNDLLSILHIYSFTAAEYGGYVNVLPDAAARQTPSPVLSGKESHPDEEIVTTVITVKTVPAAQLVPILRPLIPQYGHLAALPCDNRLILVDTFANVRRLEAVIASLDAGTEPYKQEKCEVHVSDHS